MGTQYRSAIFYHDKDQEHIAEEVIDELSEKKLWEDPIVTQVAPLDAFYAAEDYHRDYYERNPEQGYCRVVIAPKVAKARQYFLEKLKS